MLKKVLFAAAAIGLMASVPVSSQAAMVEGGMTCREAAKAKFPDNRSMRRAYKKECKAAWKATKGAPAA